MFKIVAVENPTRTACGLMHNEAAFKARLARSEFGRVFSAVVSKAEALTIAEKLTLMQQLRHKNVLTPADSALTWITTDTFEFHMGTPPVNSIHSELTSHNIPFFLILSDLIKGLCYLHNKQGVVHGDIQSETLAVREYDSAFYGAILISEKVRPSNSDKEKKDDIRSLGFTLQLILPREVPETEIERLLMARSLIWWCIQAEHVRRCSASQALEFMTNYFRGEFRDGFSG